MNNHIADAGKKPWYNQPTPLANQSAVEEYSPRLKIYVDLETARGLERRMRAAERLLADKRQITIQYQDWYRDADAHLEAARKDDDQ